MNMDRVVSQACILRRKEAARIVYSAVCVSKGTYPEIDGGMEEEVNLLRKCFISAETGCKTCFNKKIISDQKRIFTTAQSNMQINKSSNEL